MLVEIIVCQAYAGATAFFEHMKLNFPFPLKSIQVDSGSEFISDISQITLLTYFRLVHQNTIERSPRP
jgi:hypothetical protein